MQKIENCRILITGGAGFIGSNLVEHFLAQNNQVTVLDNFSTGKRENLLSFASNPDFKLIEGDIRDMDTCRRAVDGIDYVSHQAAMGSVPRSIKDPVAFTAVNILGFVNMLYTAQEAKVKRFVYASSSSVYGDSVTLPKVEDIIGKPLAPYSLSKYVDELYARNFNELYGIDTIGLRYFNVFGRRQNPYGDYAAVIPKFVMMLMKHQSPVINGDGTFSRDFTYVDNVVQANELSMLADDPAALNEAYNIAGGERVDLNSLFGQLRENLSKFDPALADIQAEYAPPRPGDIPHSLACIDKARTKLGYAPEYDFKSGLQEAVKWYWHNLKEKS